MSMRNRAPRAPRRDRFWITSNIATTIPAASNGVSGQVISASMNTDFLARTGLASAARHTMGLTIVRGWWTQAVAASSPVWLRFALGIGVYPEAMDAGDFPDVDSHQGDYKLYDSRFLLESTAADDVLFPRTEDAAGSGIGIESGSMRKVQRSTDEPTLVIQKSGATEQAIILRIVVTQLWLAP